MSQETRVGQRIREAREARGWSQEVLAREIGVSVRTITNLENGRHENGGRRRATVQKAADVLDLEVAS